MLSDIALPFNKDTEAILFQKTTMSVVNLNSKYCCIINEDDDDQWCSPIGPIMRCQGALTEQPGSCLHGND